MTGPHLQLRSVVGEGISSYPHSRTATLCYEGLSLPWYPNPANLLPISLIGVTFLSGEVIQPFSITRFAISVTVQFGTEMHLYRIKTFDSPNDSVEG